MFGLFKPLHVKETEFVALAVSHIYRNHQTAFAGIPQASRELMLYDAILKLYFAGFAKNKGLSIDAAHQYYLTIYEIMMGEINAGNIFGLKDLAVYIIAETYRFQESPSMIFNRVIQVMYKNDVDRFIMEGRKYSPSDIEGALLSPSGIESFKYLC